MAAVTPLLTETWIITTTNENLGCNVTKLTIVGTENFYTDLTALRAPSLMNWTDDDIATVMNFSDGYKVESLIMLAGDGSSQQNSGTCW